MRVNVYAAEITSNVEVVETVAENTGARFIGLRFYLESADVLKPPMHPDDDSSGVTFWVQSDSKGYKTGDSHMLRELFAEAARALDIYEMKHS